MIGTYIIAICAVCAFIVICICDHYRGKLDAKDFELKALAGQCEASAKAEAQLRDDKAQLQRDLGTARKERDGAKAEADQEFEVSSRLAKELAALEKHTYLAQPRVKCRFGKKAGGE